MNKEQLMSMTKKDLMKKAVALGYGKTQAKKASKEKLVEVLWLEEQRALVPAKDSTAMEVGETEDSNMNDHEDVSDEANDGEELHEEPAPDSQRGEDLELAEAPSAIEPLMSVPGGRPGVLLVINAEPEAIAEVVKSLKKVRIGEKRIAACSGSTNLSKDLDWTVERAAKYCGLVCTLSGKKRSKQLFIASVDDNNDALVDAVMNAAGPLDQNMLIQSVTV